jgi:hypothetical protein
MEKPILHTLLMGQSGVGKDTFAATWPKPMNVWHLDGMGQDMPYINNKLMQLQGINNGKAKDVSEFKTYQIGQSEIPYRDIVMADDGFVRVEYFSSDNPTFPNAAPILEQRMAYFHQEQGNWKTLVAGSLSAVGLEARLHEQFVMNPQFKDPRKWHGAAADYLERLIVMQKGLRCNVLFISHIGRDKNEIDGEIIFGPDLPGRLQWGSAKYFNEMYRLYVVKNDQGERVRVIQTAHDGKFECKTHIDAPNPSYPSWDGIWAGWGS